VYALEGQGVGEHFRIERDTGRLELISHLDRDPPDGVPFWRFMAQAIDANGHGLIGYADILVKVIFLGGLVNWKARLRKLKK
jgi:hypothetical protein